MPNRRAPARPFHIDLCEAGEAGVLVLGWAVRARDEEADVTLGDGTRRRGPVVLFPRPDVIDYLLHVGTPGVARGDFAESFVLAAPGATLAAARLQVRGRASDLAATDVPDAAILARYAEALAARQDSPATAFARARLRALLPEWRTDDEAPPSEADLLAACVPEGPLFASDEPLAGTLALFAVHQPGPYLSHAQRAMLAALCARGYAAVLVNSAPDSGAGRTALDEGLAAGSLTRSDHGRDVASWLLALALLGRRAAGATHVLFCNDSFCGPFDDLVGVLGHHAASGADVWGLTDSWEQGWHVQSSFFALSARALASDAFAAFRAGYAYPDRREAVVREGEVALSRALAADRSLSISVVAPYSALSRAAIDEAGPDDDDPFRTQLLADLRLGVPRNPQHVFWEALLRRHAIPFVKRDLLANNPAGVPDHWRILGVVAERYGAAQAALVEADLRAAATRAAPVR